MRRETRARELLAFDLALGEASRDPAVARPFDAPSLFRGAEQPLECLALAGFDEAGRGALAGPVVVGCVQIPRELLADAGRVERLLGGVDDSKALTPVAREAAYACIVACTRWAFGCASASEVDAVGIVAAAQRAALRAYRRLGATCELAVFDRGLSMGPAVPLDPDVCRPARRTWKEGEPDREEFGNDMCRPNSQATRLQGSPDREEFGNDVCRPNSQATRLQGSPDREEFGNDMCRPNSQATRLQGSPSRHPPSVAFTRGDMRSLHVAAASLVAKVTRDHLMECLDRAFPGFGFAQHKGYGTERHVRAIAAQGPSPVHRQTFLHRPEGPESQSC